VNKAKEKLEEYKQKASEYWSTAKEVGEKAYRAAIMFRDATNLLNPVNLVTTAGKAAFMFAKSYGVPMAQRFGSFVGTQIRRVENAYSNAVSTIKTELPQLGEKAKTYMQKAANVANESVRKIVNAAREKYETVKDAVNRGVSGAVNYVKDKIAKVQDTALKLVDKGREFIESASKIVDKVPQVKNAVNLVESSLQNAISTARTTFSEFKNTLTSGLSKVVSLPKIQLKIPVFG